MHILSGTFATALVATFTITATVPLDAAPLFVPKAQSAQSDVIQIRDGFRRGGNYGWHRGYSSNRYYGRGYHGHNDFWPGGAFIAGALIGSIIANSGYYGGYYGGHYYGDGYYPGPYYGPQYYYGDAYYRQPYYGHRYYRSRHYGNRYYGNRYYGTEYYGGGRPCTSRAADAGLCF